MLMDHNDADWAPLHRPVVSNIRQSYSKLLIGRFGFLFLHRRLPLLLLLLLLLQIVCVFYDWRRQAGSQSGGVLPVCALKI